MILWAQQTTVFGPHEIWGTLHKAKHKDSNLPPRPEAIASLFQPKLLIIPQSMPRVMLTFAKTRL